jgi:group I intron endonuclease
LLGYKHTEETIALMSLAKSGENNPMYGKTHSPETLAKLSAANGTTVYVYSSDGSTLLNTFPSARKAGEYFNCSHKTIKRYTLNGKIFKEQWQLSTSLISN